MAGEIIPLIREEIACHKYATRSPLNDGSSQRQKRGINGESFFFKLIIKTGPEAGKEIELPQKEQIIGRSSSANLVIPHPQVSQQHARFVYKEGQFFLEDLGSRNGTLLNDQPIHDQQVLKNGDEIHLGPNVVLVFREKTDTAATRIHNTAGRTVVHSLQVSKTMLDADIAQAGMPLSTPTVPPSLLITDGRVGTGRA